MVETFAALAEPNRFRIVELLRSGPRSVNDIGKRLRLAQPQVSKHLRVLKDAGLVGAHARAQKRLYGIKPQPLIEMNAWLDRYRRIWEARFDALDELAAELEEKEKRRGHEKKK
ncbi:MAG TPA: metalloregulator ArsR/SmtB family transcription factor [Polyangiaceae bacterium]